MEGFDDLAVTPAERDALGRLRAVAGGPDAPMERHCLRVRHIAAELARRRRWDIDDEVLTVAAILHDIGLYPGASRGGVYTADGAALAREMLGAYGWSAERIECCAEAIDLHHDVRRQLQRCAEVEAIRLADLVELSGGLLSFGLESSMAAHAQPRRTPARADRRAGARAVPRRAGAAAEPSADLLALL